MFLAIVMLLTLAAPAPEEESTLFSGKIGKNAYYSYDEDTCVLTISGTGGTYDYEMPGVCSFLPYSPLNFIENGIYKINALVVEDGIAELNDWLLCDVSLKYIEIAASVEYISPLMLWDCKNIEAVYYYGDAPNGGMVLSQLDKATTYHLPDAKGWDEASNYETKTFCGAPYTDVSGQEYYADAVKWGVENDILNCNGDFSDRYG